MTTTKEAIMKKSIIFSLLTAAALHAEVLILHHPDGIYSMTTYGVEDKKSHVQVFIDADNNPRTGYSKGDIRGADYLLEDNHLFRRKENSSRWSGWQKVGDIAFSHQPHTYVTFVVKDTMMQLSEEHRAVAYEVSQDWRDKKLLDEHFSSFYPPGYVEPDSDTEESGNTQEVTFQETPYALRNPLKGLMGGGPKNRYRSVSKIYVPWNKIEKSARDGADKVRRYSNSVFAGYARKNVKVMPRVLLMKKHPAFFPDDMSLQDHENHTQKFARRIRELVKKISIWDNDPRVGFVQMGIYGTWGEQYLGDGFTYNPMTPNIAKALGDSFSRYFKHKKVLVRLPQYFDKKYLQAHNNRFRGHTFTNYYNFGVYWDAWGWEHETRKSGLDFDTVMRQTRIWEHDPVLGELAMGRGGRSSHYATLDDYPANADRGTALNEIIAKNFLTPEYNDYITDYIRKFHCTGMTWLSNYRGYDKSVLKAMAKMQKDLGYRYVLKKATFSKRIEKGGSLEISFDVVNSGSARFYYDWPVEVSLIDINTKEVVWSDRFKSVNIQKWLPGDRWDAKNNRYKTAAKTYHIKERFTIPNSLKTGDYAVALAILDPAGMRPAVRFAVTNYFKDGRTPLGVIGVGKEPTTDKLTFDNINDVSGLGYKISLFQ